MACQRSACPDSVAADPVLRMPRACSSAGRHLVTWGAFAGTEPCLACRGTKNPDSRMEKLMVRSLPLAATTAAVASAVLVATCGAAAASPPATARGHGPLGHFPHVVVIYEENHSFDNLYGLWGAVNGQSVDGLAADPATTPRATQVRQDGTAYRCLYQNDPSLATPPQDAACGADAGSNGIAFTSHFANAPFDINDYITPQSATCTDPVTMQPAPGGCTRDLVHRFYQEQYQLDDGAMDRYTTGSDAVGLTQGYYDTTQLPVYQYLHGRGAPKYVVADHVFQAAFGGSFLNHQYLIAAQAPVWANAPSAEHSVVDANGMPTNYPLYTATGAVSDQPVTQACNAATTQPGLACGDYAVNTVQPPYQPSAGGSNTLPAINDVDPSQPNYEPNIGDRLSAKGVSWAWYSGGWDAANSGHPDALFQYHHQPFNYFQAYAPGTAAREQHLKDETEFMTAARAGDLPAVSFVKPAGEENEHPGYASTDNGEQHLVDLLRAVEEGDAAGNTLVVVTYDEFGGAWDHVPPPGQGSTTPGVSDQFGPGTRIPALVVGRSLPRSGVDHTVYDTTSILATIEHVYGLEPLASRDARVNGLGPALAAAGVGHTTG